MTIEEILNTDHFTCIPEGVVTEEELNFQESDKEKERLPNISTLLRASEFIDLGIINDQVTTVTATVQAIPATAMPGTAIPATATPAAVQSEEDSADDLPISKYLQQKDLPEQDLTEIQHVTESPQQKDVVETKQPVTEFPQQEETTPKKYQFPKNNQFHNMKLLKKDQKSK